MARILAIDYGQKRTGIAVTDPLQIIAGGLVTVATKDLYDFLVDYISREEVERLVVGLPRQTNGRESENHRRVVEFVSRWQKDQSVPIDLYDERFTSVLAQRAMIDAGLKKMARRDKSLVDEISATIILQDWMKANNI